MIGLQAVCRRRGRDLLHLHVADVRAHALQGFRGVLIIRVELEDAVEIVARRATTAKLVIKVGTVAVGHHRFRVEKSAVSAERTPQSAPLRRI